MEGISNGGKSITARAILECVPTWEEVINGEFGFQKLQNHYAALWEEPCITSGPFAEECKLLFEGTPTLVNVKWKEPKKN